MKDLTLRPVTDEDTTFLLSLYAEVRAAEMALVPWDDDQKQAFIAAQFKAQDDHYRGHFPDASFDLILAGEEPVGRLYVLRKDDQIRILDLHVRMESRHAGIGSHFISLLKAEAAAAEKPLRIYLEMNNPYLLTFERRGFVDIETVDGFYLLMECRSAK